jgi:CarboxypepD_reg-like domain
MKTNPLLFVFLLTLHTCLFAQNRTVSGKVTDDSGGSLAGVSVLIKGTKTGLQTNAEGNFSILLPTPGKTSLVWFPIPVTNRLRQHQMASAIPSISSLPTLKYT